jgi:hypothetical protein
MNISYCSCTGFYWRNCSHMAGFHHIVSRIRVLYDNPDYMKPVTMLYIKFSDSTVLLFGPCIYKWKVMSGTQDCPHCGHKIVDWPFFHCKTHTHKLLLLLSVLDLLMIRTKTLKSMAFEWEATFPTQMRKRDSIRILVFWVWYCITGSGFKISTFWSL